MGNGARRVGYTGVSTGRMAFNTVPRDGRPATIQDGFNWVILNAIRPAVIHFDLADLCVFQDGSVGPCAPRV